MCITLCSHGPFIEFLKSRKVTMLQGILHVKGCTYGQQLPVCILEYVDINHYQNSNTIMYIINDIE